MSPYERWDAHDRVQLAGDAFELQSALLTLRPPGQD